MQDTPPSATELATFVQQQKVHAGDAAFADIEADLRLLEQGEWPFSVKSRGRGAAGKRISRAVFEELNRFLCSNDPEYATLKKRATSLTEKVIWALAGVVSTKVGISLAIAAGSIGLVALSITKLGVGVFCRLSNNKQSPLNPGFPKQEVIETTAKRTRRKSKANAPHGD